MSLIAAFYKGLKPIPMTRVSQWADENRYLTSESAAEPGRWHTGRVPFMEEIMDNMSPNSPFNDCILVKGVQIAGTESMLNVVGCYMDIAPCPIMYVMPTIEVAKGFSESRVDPMIQASPALSAKVRPSRERDSGNTKFVKRGPGFIFTISGSNSAASLRSRPVRVLLLDEVDAYPNDADGEGSPIKLALKRQVTFGLKRKTMLVSTPTLEHTSQIWPAYLNTDQRKYFVPCPYCGHMQELKFENLRYSKDDTANVRYECSGPDCSEVIEERFKTKMLAKGKWIATNPEKHSATKRGYHINSLYSPIGWLSWSSIVEEYEEAVRENDDNKMKVFVNTILGEPWKEKGEVPDYKNLYNRRESYKIGTPPKEVVFLTAGVDVQKDRLEILINGWGRHNKIYSVEYLVYPGQTSDNDVWDRLAMLPGSTWEREDGILLPLRLMAVDTGYNTSKAYEFCRRFNPTQVIPIKGQDKQNVMVVPPRQVDTTAAGDKIGKLKVWNIGVSMIKSEIYGRLKLEKENGVAPRGYIFFPQYDEQFFRGITSEQLQVVIKNGFKKYEWVKTYHGNEPLDCLVYSRAAAAVVGIDRMSEDYFNRIEQSYIPKSIEPRPDTRQNDEPEDQRYTKKRSIWD